MEKTIFQIAFTETIVFSAEQCDTIISFSSAGMRWWFQGQDGMYVCSDTLHHTNDLSRASVAYARKLASDWFDHTLNEFNGGSRESFEDKSKLNDMVTTVYDGGKVVSVTYGPATPEKKISAVVPPWLDENKKDAHTEHCCSAHRVCKYSSKKCTVVTGRKKPSYPCNCNK